MFKPHKDDGTPFANNKGLIEAIEIDLDLIYDIGKDRIEPDKNFKDLVNSIKKQGLVKHILVIPDDKGKYCIVSGRRRLKAFKELGYKTIPAISNSKLKIEEYSIEQLIENTQNPLSLLDNAVAIKRRMDKYKLSLSDVAEIINMDRSEVSRVKNLVNSRLPIQKLAIEAKLKSAGNLLFLEKNILDNNKLEKTVNDILSGKRILTDVVIKLRNKLNKNKSVPVNLKLEKNYIIYIAKTLDRTNKNKDTEIKTIDQALVFFEKKNKKYIEKKKNDK